MAVRHPPGTPVTSDVDVSVVCLAASPSWLPTTTLHAWLLADPSLCAAVSALFSVLQCVFVCSPGLRLALDGHPTSGSSCLSGASRTAMMTMRSGGGDGSTSMHSSYSH